MLHSYCNIGTLARRSVQNLLSRSAKALCFRRAKSKAPALQKQNKNEYRIPHNWTCWIAFRNISNSPIDRHFYKKSLSGYCDWRLRFCEQHKRLEIYAFVVMINHIHRTNKTNEECEMKDLLFTFDSFCKAGALILTRRSEDATPSVEVTTVIWSSKNLINSRFIPIK
jgi:hypothetical protein